MTGLIDVHSHLLPGVDDGCKTFAESLACARLLVEAGYSHCFCTPHIWPTYDNTIDTIPGNVTQLQSHLDAAGINLRLLPGGEINLRAEYASTPREKVMTYALQNRHVLIDMWHEK